MSHLNQWKLRNILQELFVDPDSDLITKKVTAFLLKHPIPMTDFPLIKGTYSRTIFFRSDNGFEAMAARWSRGTTSPIHGHPYYTLYYVVNGRLGIDNYKKAADRIEKTTSEILSRDQFLSFTGKPGTFDNHIHKVEAIEETLSIHISSNDATKGEVFNYAG